MDDDTLLTNLQYFQHVSVVELGDAAVPVFAAMCQQC
jgi:hypothetical protein